MHNVAASTNTSVTVAPPGIYQDTPPAAPNYYAIVTWKWNNTAYLNDGCCGNLGGPDGFAMAFNQKVLPVPSQSYVIEWSGNTSYYPLKTSSTPSSSNAYGAGFTIQDKDNVGPNDINTAFGEEVISFKGTASGTCQSLQAFAKYSHTWNTTSVTGVSLGASEAGFSWSTTSNHWTSASQAGAIARIC